MNPNPFLSLLHSRKFWLAMLGLVQTLIFQFVPAFPQEVWISINVLLMTVIVGITVEDAAEKRSDTYVVNEAPPEECVQEEGLG